MLSNATEDLERLSEQDLQFLLQLLDTKVENILKLSRPLLHPSYFMDTNTEIPADMFCRGLCGLLLILECHM